ncbi:MAG: hypothetical protein QOJ98_89 [Acidobacteriota bacterium]|jgi:hypothetical protein|nr:hypothetical protein [Acidobacteriota bacterium]
MVARTLVLLSLLALASLAHAQPRPVYSVQPNGIVAATLPGSILADSDVQKRLTSGLTTTFLIAARNRATNAISGARLEVRYDLWDEVWLVRRIEFDRKSERQRIASMADLEKWWRTPLRLLSTDADRVSLQLDLTVLPFSAAESEDARQWISKSGGVGTAGGGGGVVDALIGTTINAKPITSYRWNVELALK